MDRRLKPSENIRKIYLQAMQDYTEWVNKFPEELLTEAEDEIKAGTLMRRRKIKNYLIGFRKQLQDKGLSDNTMKSRLTGVKSFYRSFEVEIPSIARTGNGVNPLKENMGIPIKDDIQEILKVCDPLEKHWFLLGHQVD